MVEEDRIFRQMTPKSTSPTPWKAIFAAGAAAGLIRGLGLTWRVRLDDPLGYSDPEQWRRPLIWAFWHNRIAPMPLVYQKWFRHRRCVVLTSPSKDGEVLARTMGHFDLGAVRGSSSRRGARAMVELARHIRGGTDVIFTPDGPRGPKYHLHPGLVQLASLTETPVVPIVVEISRYHSFKSWDAFRLPLPGATSTARMLEAVTVPSGLDEPGFEEMRLRIESRLRDASCDVTKGA
jgi:lysophospholipid acyltransferase (LPLAT)-like uncharacterized protein